MARRRKRSELSSEFAKPILGLVLLGLLWAAWQFGLVTMLSEALIGILTPG